ncbi:hypothetical protein RR46_07465 [Papilio xuthus]|uniref:Uncharacterized protein n=1 Tax=Papilio xuthus TaxID=66420 RepID=A0A194PXH1_PAPXU|nr:hypothetical protein RR46_07465 [Papilio xuthus]
MEVYSDMTLRRENGKPIVIKGSEYKSKKIKNGRNKGLLRYKVDFQSMQLDDEEIDNLYDVDDY